MELMLFPFFTSIVFQPKALNLSKTLSVKQVLVGPSKLILLESYNTIKLFNLLVPAKEAAS